jgi:glycerol uptake facilitator-like aquaporin
VDAGLLAGVLAPILFTGVYLVAGATRAGYNPLRHQVSLLSLGDGGPVMIATFLVTGALLILFAFALRKRLADGQGALAAPVALGLTGLGLVLAGLFSTQPLFGYPPGTPEGMATDVSPASFAHVLGAFLLVFGLIAATLVLARRFRREGRAGWAVSSLVVGLVIFLFFGASGGGPSGQLIFPAISGLLQRISLIAGLGWVAVLALSEIRFAR